MSSSASLCDDSAHPRFSQLMGRSVKPPFFMPYREEEMKLRILPFLAALCLLGSAFFVARADAYLHVANASGACSWMTRPHAEYYFATLGHGYWYPLTGGDNTNTYQRYSDSQVRVLCTHMSTGLWLSTANAVIGGSDGYEYMVSWYWCYQGYQGWAGGVWGCPAI